MVEEVALPGISRKVSQILSSRVHEDQLPLLQMHHEAVATQAGAQIEQPNLMMLHVQRNRSQRSMKVKSLSL